MIPHASQFNNMASVPHATPESQGISSEDLYTVLTEMDQKAPCTHGIAFMKNGKLICSAVKKPFNTTMPRMVHSVSKSFTSMAIGLLVTDGLLDINSKFIDFHRDKLPDGYDPRFENLTVKHILMFNSNRVSGSTFFVGRTDDWVKYYLSFTLPRDPGTGYEYDGGGSMALCSLVNKITGKSAFELLNERIFMPMGITDTCWLQSPQGVSSGGWGLYMGLDTMVKIGSLWAHYGNWEGKQLISEEYMREATTWQTDTGMMGKIQKCEHYGYQFWLGDNDFNAIGASGAFISANAHTHTAVALIANAPYTEAPEVFELLRKYVHVDGPALPENPEAQAKLQAKIDSLAIAGPEGDASDAEIEEKLFGRTIYLKENSRDIRSLYFMRRDDETLIMNVGFSDRNVALFIGHKEWMENVTPRMNIKIAFPDEAAIHITHTIRYAFKDGKLIIHDLLMQTNYTDTYTFEVKDGKLVGDFLPQYSLGTVTSEALLEL